METNAAPESSTQSGGLGRPPKLSEELDRVQAAFAERTVQLHEVITLMGGRAYDLLLLLLGIPFLLPIPIPGLSTVFGTIIAVIAGRLTLGQRPWLPKRLLAVELPPKFFPKLLGGAKRLLKIFEFLLRPRYLWMTRSPLPQVHAFIIVIAAVVLLLPLPPGTNFPPAVVIVLLAGGLLERDGLFIFCGYLAFVVNVVFFTLLGIFGTKLFEIAWHHFFG